MNAFERAVRNTVGLSLFLAAATVYTFGIPYIIYKLSAINNHEPFLLWGLMTLFVVLVEYFGLPDFARAMLDFIERHNLRIVRC